MDYEKIIYAVAGSVIGIVATVIGAIITHLLAGKREKRGRIYNNKEKALKDVYAPIYKILLSDLSDSLKYKGTVKIDQIEEIVRNNSELVDSQLLKMVQETRQGIRFVDGPTMAIEDRGVMYDVDRKFFIHIHSKYNSLKKELGLPYDTSEGIN
ncbi:hypothetical protein [Bacillus wiedmannii]|uniref:Uncharacterized protein n=1 Tax=Bacillus wiedmannii TaxID=1890302 RepID=A0A2C4PZ71_9BACI|nr:hypothetical protein [Bacillus wiedmannii]KPU55545.1 hypothetical protein AN402_3798 [Bacillus wiedmannii]PHD57428.1 hypothetical protein COF57_23375 [Bacillus wiedmannii]PRT34061.1 hypothetical protein C6358_07115 [Bacillus wiedmannii]PRT45328.1 hypothetical protein C6359_07175 [Bacillus wiedmannii]